jgi:hypothetical protein
LSAFLEGYIQKMPAGDEQEPLDTKHFIDIKKKIRTKKNSFFLKYPLLYPLSANLLSSLSAVHQDGERELQAMKKKQRACLSAQ